MSMHHVARHSFTRGAAQARRLNANRTIAPSVLASTISLEPEFAACGSVQNHYASLAFQRGSLIVRQGEYFFLVESDAFTGRFYCLVKRNGAWLSSASDERVTARLIAKVA